jgi:hypothetical protein
VKSAPTLELPQALAHGDDADAEFGGDCLLIEP